MEKVKSNERIIYLDLLRIVSIFFMILLHVASSNWKKVSVRSMDWVAFTGFDGLARFCVPVFVMISGALFLNHEKEYTFEKLKRNIAHIACVFYVWSAIYTVYKFRGGIFDINNLEAILKYFLLGHSRMWFLWMIVGLYLLVPFLRKIAENKKLVEAYLIMSFFTVSIVGLIKMLLGDESLIIQMVNKLNVSFLGGYTGYFLLGHYLHEYELSKKKRSLLYIVGGISAIFTIIGTIIISSTPAGANSKLFNYLLPNVLFVASAVFLVFKQAFGQVNRFNECQRRMIVGLSNLCLGIYMVHTLIENVLIHVLGITTLSFSGLVSVPVITMIIFLCSIFCAFIISKVSILRKYML